MYAPLYECVWYRGWVMGDGRGMGMGDERGLEMGGRREGICLDVVG